MTAEPLGAVLGQLCPHGLTAPVDGRFSRYSCPAPAGERSVSGGQLDIQGQLLGVLIWLGLWPPRDPQVSHSPSSLQDRLGRQRTEPPAVGGGRLQLLLQRETAPQKGPA